MAIYEGAYISEIVRGGINGVSKGQWEAAWSMGLSQAQTFRLVVLPQAFRRTAFPLAGQFISTIKDSAIVSVISVQELTFQGMELMAATFLTFEIWITITLLYFLLTFSLSRTISFFENAWPSGSEPFFFGSPKPKNFHSKEWIIIPIKLLARPLYSN